MSTLMRPSLMLTAARCGSSARDAGVAHCVIPAVERSNFDTVRKLAHAEGDSYCLGIHPLYVAGAQDADLVALDEALTAHAADPRLVAVGEIGLDYFVPALCKSPLRERQEAIYRAAAQAGPQTWSARGAACAPISRTACSSTCATVPPARRPLAWHCPRVQRQRGAGRGIHQARVQAGVRRRASRSTARCNCAIWPRRCRWTPWCWRPMRPISRRIGCTPLQSSAPPAMPQGRNAPAELPRFAERSAEIRGISVDALAAAALHNSLQALPKLGRCWYNAPWQEKHRSLSPKLISRRRPHPSPALGQ